MKLFGMSLPHIVSPRSLRRAGVLGMNQRNHAYIMRYNRSSTNYSTISNHDVSTNNCIGSYPDVIPNLTDIFEPFIASLIIPY